MKVSNFQLRTASWLLQSLLAKKYEIFQHTVAKKHYHHSLLKHKTGANTRSQTLEATFDGEVLLPDEPIALEPNTRVRVVIEAVTQTQIQPVSFLRVARSLQLDGPADWSTHLDSYLYENEAQSGA